MTKNKLDCKNTRKFLEEAKELDNMWEAWRKADFTADKGTKEFVRLTKKQNTLAKKIAKAFYKDTRDRNSWNTISSVYLSYRYPRGGELPDMVNMEPLSFVNWCLGLGV